MSRVGTDLKEKLFQSMKNTWNSLFQVGIFKHDDQPTLEEQVNKAIEEELTKELTNDANEYQVNNEDTDLSLGILNKQRRIDYVLQEAPLEFFNEYIFALTSHVCYW